MSTRSARFRIATAIESVVADRGQRAVGHMIGHAGSTVGRWNSDLSCWSVAALLDLAAADAAFLESVIHALTELDQQRHQRNAVTAACRAISTTSGLSSLLASDIADGEISADERAELMPRIRDAIKVLTDLEGNLA